MAFDSHSPLEESGRGIKHFVQLVSNEFFSVFKSRFQKLIWRTDRGGGKVRVEQCFGSK